MIMMFCNMSYHCRFGVWIHRAGGEATFSLATTAKPQQQYTSGQVFSEVKATLHESNTWSNNTEATKSFYFEVCIGRELSSCIFYLFIT